MAETYEAPLAAKLTEDEISELISTHACGAGSSIYCQSLQLYNYALQLCASSFSYANPPGLTPAQCASVTVYFP
jgi:hypothetical protein